MNSNKPIIKNRNFPIDKKINALPSSNHIKKSSINAKLITNIKKNIGSKVKVDTLNNAYPNPSEDKLQLACNQKECNVMTFVKDYITPIYQVLSIELPAYHMKLRTTKCLNTSIMTMYLLLGTKGITKSEYCSVQNIRKRVAANSLQRKDDIMMYDRLIKDIFSTKDKYRNFYYIMITDGNMKKNNLRNVNNDEEYFPGHVFVIEKIPCISSKTNKYKLYQSYINEYDLEGHYEKNQNSMDIDEEKLRKILEFGTKQIFSQINWNQEISYYWQQLTHVDASKYDGYCTDELKFCYQKVKVVSCYKILLKFVNSALKQLSLNENKYYIEGAIIDQLSSKELISKLLELKEKILKLYNIYNVVNK